MRTKCKECGHVHETGEYVIRFDASGSTSTVLGRLLRIIAFPFTWIFFGQAKL